MEFIRLVGLHGIEGLITNIPAFMTMQMRFTELDTTKRANLGESQIQKRRALIVLIRSRNLI